MECNKPLKLENDIKKYLILNLNYLKVMNILKVMNMMNLIY